MPQPLYATVAVDQPLDAAYTYLVPPELARDVHAGSRVTVPLGRSNRSTPATVLSLSETPPVHAAKHAKPSPEPPADEEMLFEPGALQLKPEEAAVKSIETVLRDVAPVPQDLLDLAQWISTYYCAPIGMTLATMVPAAVKRGTRLPANSIIHLADPTRPAEEQLQTLKTSPKTKKIFTHLHGLLQPGPMPEHELLAAAEIARPMLKRLLSLGLLRIEREIKLPEHLPPGQT